MNVNTSPDLPTITPRVVAVVVTYNRAALLSECCAALRAQTAPLSEIIIVDNASTDETPTLTAGFGAPFTVERLPSNLGGAAGFAHGLEVAVTRDADWIWLLDDDTIAAPDALEALLHASTLRVEGRRPTVLCSRVEWTDTSLHPMNVPIGRLDPPAELFGSVTAGVLPIRYCSFVSALFARDSVQRHGLPLRDFFIWNDDVEYTARILRTEFGVCVPASVVVHKTALKHVPLVATGERFYYEIRNKLWMLKRRNTWTKEERLLLLLVSLRRAGQYVKFNRFNRTSLTTVARALRDGLLGRALR